MVVVVVVVFYTILYNDRRKIIAKYTSVLIVEFLYTVWKTRVAVPFCVVKKVA